MKFDFEIGGGFVKCSMGSGGDDPNVVVREFSSKVETRHTFLALSRLAQHMLSVVPQDMPLVSTRFLRLLWCLHSTHHHYLSTTVTAHICICVFCLVGGAGASGHRCLEHTH